MLLKIALNMSVGVSLFFLPVDTNDVLSFDEYNKNRTNLK